MTEGRKREIRRLFTSLDIEILRLVRTSIAGIADRTLGPGEYRALSFNEIRDIYASIYRGFALSFLTGTGLVHLSRLSSRAKAKWLYPDP